jgi:predicted acetyltransferase
MRLQRVPQLEHPELADAMRPYLAELAKLEAGQDGAASLDYPYLPLYWTESGREAYWLEERGQRVGLALINRHALVRIGAWSVAEFYVTPAWRRKGLGRQGACALFSMHPGWWEIKILPGHLTALSFWTTVLEGCSGDRLERFQPGTVVDWEGSLLVADVPPIPALQADDLGR